MKPGARLESLFHLRHRLPTHAWFGPALLAVLFVLVLATLLWMLRQRTAAELHADLIASTHTAKDSIERRLSANEDYLRLLANSVAHGEVDAAQFEQRLNQYLPNHPELLGVLWVDGQSVVRWAIPQASYRSLQGERWPQPTQLDLSTFYTDAELSPKGASAFELYLPLGGTADRSGNLVAIYSCDRLLRYALAWEVFRSHHVSLVESDGSVIVAMPRQGEVDERLSRTVSLTPLSNDLQLRLSRYGEGFWGWGFTLLILICVGLVMGMAWGMWALKRQVHQRVRAEEELREAHDRLEERVQQRTADLKSAKERLEQEIAERERVERHLQQHRDQLAHMARVSTMGELAAGLAHELNQPLGTIASFAQGGIRLLEREPVDHANLRLAMSEVVEQARRAGQIIHRLRSFVADRTPQRIHQPLGPLVQEVVDLIHDDAKQQQVELTVDHAESLPQVLADRIQIEQVLLNLMRNALEAMAETDRRPRRLTVSTRVVNETVQVCVGDTGPGCSSQQIAKLFDPFFTTKADGMGMGLAISRSIIEAHGGWLRAEPGPEGGMCLSFALPASPEYAAT